MMRFLHFHRGATSIGRAVPRGAAILIAAIAGGCSAEVTRFDFPGFSLTDKENTNTSSLQQQASAEPASRGPSYLGNEGQGDAPRTWDRGGYVAPQGNRGSDVGRTALNEPDSTRNPNSEPQTYQPPAASVQRPPERGQAFEVQQGDTLYSLSRRHHVSVAELMQVNDLNNPNLHLGQKLYLPAGYQIRRPLPRETQTAARAPMSVSPALEAKYDASHTMGAGESLYGVAKSYGVTVAEMQQVNGITDARAVRVGTVLKVPGGSASEPAPAYTPPPVADAAPVVHANQPTIINRKETRVASLDDGATGALPSPGRTGDAARRSAGDKLRWPVHGKIVTGFGARNDGTHNDGIDVSVPLGTSVQAAESGVVAYAGSELKGYGNLVLLRHDNGWVTAYANNDELLVKRGDKVQRGQVIAKAGKTGAVDQPQLHFELRQGSKPVDPVPFLEQM